ncbi:hypothetical protein L7F22_021028 [Adiantum nelumboides]|nr:hypothetical protein [Adiantum nelumboides]
MTSNLWKGLFENLGTRLNFSSAYHPQTDGQSEIANLTILDLLKSYVTEVDQRSQWEKYLPLVEYAYNNTVHTSTGKAPFEVIEGRSKSPLLLKVHGKIFAADEYSRDLKESFQKIKEAISISQQKQKAAANKHRRALAFKENDWVLLKFPKARLRHTSGKNPTGHQKYYAKLAKRYYGPFQILKPINEMAYQLKLPNHWLIHNAFHVSLLKPYKGEPPSEAIMEDPPEVEDQEEVLQPESILRHEDKAVIANGPFEKWGIDAMGPLPRTANGKLYILVAIDYMTRFGTPLEIISDNGPGFRRGLLTEVCEELKVSHGRSTPYYPQSNGLVEKANGIIAEIIRKMVESKPKRWDNFLDWGNMGI